MPCTAYRDAAARAAFVIMILASVAMFASAPRAYAAKSRADATISAAADKGGGMERPVRCAAAGRRACIGEEYAALTLRHAD